MSLLHRCCRWAVVSKPRMGVIRSTSYRSLPNSAIFGIVSLPNAFSCRNYSHTAPRRKAVSPPSTIDGEEYVNDTPTFESSTLSEFITVADSGIMPGGEKSEHGAVPPSEMHHFFVKYSDWATGEWAQLPSVPTPFGPMSGDSPSPIIRISFAMGGMEDLFAGMFTGLKADEKFGKLERSDKMLKSSLWFGMTPLSDAQWRFRKLDDIENIYEAIAVIRQVVSIFEYMAQPKIQGKLRTAHNKIYVEMDIFQHALEELREAQGRPEFNFNIVKIWQEYIEKLFQFRVLQTRAWTFKHLSTLLEAWIARVMKPGRVIDEKYGTLVTNSEASDVVDKLLTLHVDAEIALRSRIQGFYRVTGVEDVFGNVLEAPEADLNLIYARMDAERPFMIKEALKHTTAFRTEQRHAAGTTGRGNQVVEDCLVLYDREWAIKSVQKHNVFTASSALQVEPWIAKLQDVKVQRFGFVVYQLSYTENQEERKTLKAEIEAGMDSGWEGFVGADTIKSKQVLHWIDGKQEGIPEGDLEAAKEHFRSFQSSPAFQQGLSTKVFLGLTPASITSFKDFLAQGTSTKHNRPWIHTIEVPISRDNTSNEGTSKPEPKAPFTKSKAKESKKSAPSNTSKPETEPYNGSVKVIDQLIWTDLFPKSILATSGLVETCHALASQHPQGLYIGPTNHVLRRRWREAREMGAGFRYESPGS